MGKTGLTDSPDSVLLFNNLSKDIDVITDVDYLEDKQYWDSKAKETLRIDLWTKDMPVDEMKQFFHQTLVAMADTFQRATADEKMSDTMRDFCDYFAEKMELKA